MVSSRRHARETRGNVRPTQRIVFAVAGINPSSTDASRILYQFRINCFFASPRVLECVPPDGAETSARDEEFFDRDSKDSKVCVKFERCLWNVLKN